MIAIGKSGNVYPRIKFAPVRGEENSLIKNEVLRSLETNIPENKEIKEKPKTAIPGVRFSISNKLTGTLDWMRESKNKMAKGNPMPKAKFRGSLKISFVLREANANVFISIHLHLWPA
jgi:hypothetical protein